MSTKSFGITTVALFLLLGGAWAGLKKYNQHLSGKIGGQAFTHQEVSRLREENARLQRLVVQTQAGVGAAELAMATDLENARTEFRNLKIQRERAAAEKTSRAKTEMEALNANRDPESGPVRIENFRNVGRASPSAAFQTLIWAAVTGTEDALAESVALEAESRAMLLELLAGFSPEARAKYRSPENLVSVFIAADIFNGAAAQIIGQSNEGPDRVILSVRVADKSRDAQAPMRRTSDGWRLVITEAQVKKLIARLRETPPGR